MSSTQDLVTRARAAQAHWAALDVSERLARLKQCRHRLAHRGEDFARLIGPRPGRSEAESIMAEVLPLADACEFLENNAARLLAPQKLSAGRPAWLFAVRAEIQRLPLGVVLIIGPSNYPLFLAGVPALQALAAGNAAIIKPGAGGGPVLKELAIALHAAGIDPALCPVLDESVESAREILALGGDGRAGVDKVVLTGSVNTGTAVLGQLATRGVPATMELSGCDAVFVLPGADLNLTARALRYGLRLNAGATCIAPRRVFVDAEVAEAFEAHLRVQAETLPAVEVPTDAATRALEAIRFARESGARWVMPESQAHFDVAWAETTQGKPRIALKPLLVAETTPSMALLREDLFAPVMGLMTVDGVEAALAAAAQCPYALGASIFGPREAARALAGRIRAGMVVINDMIAPTADPRLPFGGLGKSGFGRTRGAEGLLEMTAAKSVTLRGGTFRPHFDDPQPGDAELFKTYLRAAHGPKWGARMGAWAKLLKGLMRRKPPGDASADGEPDSSALSDK